MAEKTLVLELAEGRGDPVRVEWGLSELAAMRSGEPPRFGLEGLDAERWQLARVFCGALADGLLVAVAALRPGRAHGHGEEAVAGAVVRNGEATMLDETLLSVEYGPDGEPRRLGLELYERPDSLPLRIVGALNGRPSPGTTRFELLLGGVEGAGVLTVIEPA